MNKHLLTKYYTFLRMSHFLKEDSVRRDMQHKLFIKFVASDETDDVDGDIDPVLFSLIPYVYGSYTSGIKELLQTYQSIKKEESSTSANKKLENKLNLLIHEINEHVVENTPHEIANYDALKIIMNQTTNYIQLRQYVNFYDYILNKEIDSDCCSQEPCIIDAGEFGKMNRSQLVDLFRAERFYNLDDEQRMQLFQAVINDYCEQNGVKSAGLKIETLPISNKTICYGEYNPMSSEISLNKSIIDCIDQAKENNNTYLPYKILATLVHEAQHRVQFENYDNPSSVKMGKILDKMKNMEHYAYKSQIDYQTAYEELDARDCTIGYFKTAMENCGDLTLEKFYNSLIIQENKTKKRAIPASDMADFENIYFSERTRNNFNLNYSKKEFLEILNSNNFQNIQ